MIRVLLADDEPLILAGVHAVLSTDPAVTVVAQARDGREAIALAQAHRPDVALLDIRMPLLDGISAAAAIGRTVPQTAACILTTFGEDQYVARAIGEGIQGFTLKSGDPRELLTGVHALAAGGAYLSPAVAQWVIGHLRDDLAGLNQIKSRVERLTSRERDVLTLLGEGLSNGQIARRLHLVEGTVKAHVSAILVKLHADNRVQAAIVAHQAGLA
ncbi:response regulator transcription factor [Rhodococcus erythropolis]|nr:response regulator transcription factor [Rhodococcus erythropolis]